MSCIIVGCQIHSSRLKDQVEIISFHRFPKDDAIREKWLKAVARTNWEWKKQHRICSRHFAENCFINPDHKWRRLKPNAVPSLHLRSEMNVVASTSSIKAVPTSRLMPLPQQIDLTSHQIYNLKTENERLKKVARQRFLKINSLRQKIRRLRKNNTDLNTRLTDILKNEKIGTENLLLLEIKKNNPVIITYLTK